MTHSAPGLKIEVKCQRCRQPFMARVADRKRGWGKFCSKSCKAIKQTQDERRLNPYVDNATYLEHQREHGGIPQFNRRGEYEGFVMSQEDLSYGGYGDADHDTPFGEGKW